MPIPRRIIQTHRNASIEAALRQTWRDHHPDYEYLFFDDVQCRAFLAERMPSLLATYDLLPLAVQKADLFRYAVVFELGGTYADVDTICCAPLHSYLDLAGECLFAGIEMEAAQYPGGMAEYIRYYCPPFQLLQWTFSAPPRHPALAVLLERIRFLCSRLSADTLAEASRVTRFTLELTGPMHFTQVMTDFLAGTRDGVVALLPRQTWGAWLTEQTRPDIVAEVKVRHLFQGAWKPQKERPMDPATASTANVPARPGADAAPRINYNIRF